MVKQTTSLLVYTTYGGSVSLQDKLSQNIGYTLLYNNQLDVPWLISLKFKERFSLLLCSNENQKLTLYSSLVNVSIILK